MFNMFNKRFVEGEINTIQTLMWQGGPVLRIMLACCVLVHLYLSMKLHPICLKKKTQINPAGQQAPMGYLNAEASSSSDIQAQSFSPVRYHQ